MTQLQVDSSRSPQRVLSLRAAGREGWLVIDTVANGLCFGGMRITPDVNELEVRQLARAMTLKLAGHGLPTGGAKAGLRCHPSELADGSLLKAFAHQLKEALEESTVLGKDMGASDALLDGLYAAVGKPQLHLVRSHGNRAERIRDLTGYVPHMTGRGAAWAAAAALGGSLQGRRVAIQGAGVVGVGAAVRVAELGAKVVAMNDAFGMVASPAGIPVSCLLAATQGPERRLNPDAIAAPHLRAERDALFSVEADVLLLAASSSSVDERLAQTVRAPLVVEASNFGLTDGARTLLHQSGKLVIPDVIASSASAAMVCRQLAAGNSLDSESLWKDIRASIETSVRLAMQDAAAERLELREAYVRRVAKEVRA